MGRREREGHIGGEHWHVLSMNPRVLLNAVPLLNILSINASARRKHSRIKRDAQEMVTPAGPQCYF